MTNYHTLSNNLNNYPMYDDYPKELTTISHLESIITIRLKILDELHKLINLQTKKTNILDTKISNILLKLIKHISWDNEKELLNDNISFYMLGLIFCKNESDRQWLADIESKFYIIRLNQHNINKDMIFKRMNIPLLVADETDKNILDKINFKSKNFDNKIKANIFKIPFNYVLDLIPTMNYFIKDGYVYISDEDRFSIVETVFKQNIYNKYTKLSKLFDIITSDKRITSLIKNVENKREISKLDNEKLFNKDKNRHTGEVSLNDIEDLASNSFPLCMQLLHKTLSKESHLKHNGRLQYGLFLKGIGLSLEDSINFWKRKFSAKTTPDKFEKDYTYSIRHNYGMEGKRANYPPWSCVKIQNLNTPSSSEFHGCPFKIMSSDKLKSLLYNNGFKESDVLKILEKKNGNEWSIACMKHFEAKLNSYNYEKVGIHPNYYYESAIKVHKSFTNNNNNNNNNNNISNFKKNFNNNQNTNKKLDIEIESN